ncbi:Hypothetical predicted protein [Olea europaea subsp. europaea]|uniref:Uncharacterized protein n=1 Tax=Olea europaea subsp. europaea TaxID=158383 RepID=A0A8S0RYH4_OLEEU|nr:Hypothetical predicted protein [Olea europaea subsp. europaea]
MKETGVNIPRSSLGTALRNWYNSAACRSGFFPKVAIAMGFVLWNNNTVSSDDFLKPKTAALWWKRVILNAYKVGKGSSIDTKAHILVLKHWIEAVSCFLLPILEFLSLAYSRGD